MHQEKWQRVEALVEEALDLKADEQSAFLAQLAAEDPWLRGEVASLLDAHRHMSSFLETPISDVLQPQEKATEFEAGQQVGAYRIVRLLGRGGMGEVYLARRHDDFTKEVALKVVRQGLRHQDVKRRFEQERQILADLEHPNIARLLDGGTAEIHTAESRTAESRASETRTQDADTAEDGIAEIDAAEAGAADEGQPTVSLPYLVMEYVDGQAIDRFCDDRHASIEERLRLFGQVCEAVQYAHQKLLIHRDLKPKNILVTAEGVPKLLDFGIAKIIEESSSGDGAAQTLLRPLTPSYASPEQLQGMVLGTTSDVYSLGVLLYELLAGQLPFRRDRPLNHPEELEPPPPSLAVAKSPNQDEIANLRGLSSQRIARRLRGDLDNIVLKALQPDPTARYASVEQLQDDLRRHLEGLPIKARPAVLGYRLRKFARRHRGAVAAALMLFGLGVGFLVQTQRNAVAIAAERDRASEERKRAEQVTHFLTELFTAADPKVAQGEPPSLNELLERGYGLVPTELMGQPALRASFLHTLGKIHANLGHSQKAEAMLQESLRLKRELANAPSLDLADTLSALAQVYSDRGAPPKAATLHREALEHRRALLGEDDPAVAESLYLLGSSFFFQGELEKAETLLRQSLALQDPEVVAVDPERAEDRAYTLNHLARARIDLGNLEGVEELLDEALRLSIRVHGREHSQVAGELDTLASLQRAQGRFPEAIANLRESLRIRRAIFPEEHLEIVAGLNNLGAALGQAGEQQEAYEVSRASLTALQQHHSSNLRYLMTGLHNLARNLSRLGRHAEAEAKMREARAMLPESWPQHHPGRLHLDAGMGEVLLARGKPSEAEPYLRLAVEARAGADPERLALEQLPLADCLISLGRFDEAESLLTESLKILENQGRSEAQLALNLLIDLHEAQRNTDRAEHYRQELQALTTAQL